MSVECFIKYIYVICYNRMIPFLSLLLEKVIRLILVSELFFSSRLTRITEYIYCLCFLDTIL